MFHQFMQGGLHVATSESLGVESVQNAVSRMGRRAIGTAVQCHVECPQCR